MENRVIIARERFYDKSGFVGSIEFLFSTYELAYQHYIDHHFTVEPKFRGAKKFYPETGISPIIRCVVNFFDEPVKA